MARSECRVTDRDGIVTLHSPHFEYELDLTGSLEAIAWENLVDGRRIELGEESAFEVDVDASDERILITGWRTTTLADDRVNSDLPAEYSGFERPYFDDSSWESRTTPYPANLARTHVFLPPATDGRDVLLTLGGIGLFDAREMRVFVNGTEVGTRSTAGRWSDPTTFVLEPDSPEYAALRFGQDNVVALRLGKYQTRTARLNELDPLHDSHLNEFGTWNAQFEQYLTVGERHRTVEFEVADYEDEGPGDVTIHLRGVNIDLLARVSYTWAAEEPTLSKEITVTNAGSEDVRVMDLRLGEYSTGVEVTDGERGFPVYLADDRFVSVAHPSGWAIGEDGRVELRQHPGERLGPDQTFTSMEVVFGVADRGRARERFLDHVRGRMRRVRRGHDEAIALFDAFGGWSIPDGQFLSDENSEEIVLDSLAHLAEGSDDGGCPFDYYNLHFWVDSQGDLERFDPDRFPDGLERIRNELEPLDVDPGLWIDSSVTNWTIGENPLVAPTITEGRSYTDSDRLLGKALCRATDPIKTMYSTAFSHHLEENGVRLVKFDGLRSTCYNPDHDHLPGVYATEAIQSSVIETLNDLDATHPDVFLMLYWGHRSPWWLLHADTLFEPGLSIEGASPGPEPSLYVRDSVIRGLDKAQWWCRDVPSLGKDSLGVWLSEWPWNSSIGTERWREALLLDMCRGNLLVQPWSDEDWLTPSERADFAEFVELLRERADCFRNPRFVLGNPWEEGPYGYCCTDGERAFVAVNNCTWSDRTVTLRLNEDWGLPDQSEWELYRWHPEPARLRPSDGPVGDTVSLALRPFDVVLLEAVPAGDRPSLDGTFEDEPLAAGFAEPSREVALSIDAAPDVEPRRVPREDAERPDDVIHGDRWPDEVPEKRVVTVSGEAPANRDGGLLVVTTKLREGGQAVERWDLGKDFAVDVSVRGDEVGAQPVVREETYPASWQGWRIPIAPADEPVPFRATVTVAIPAGVNLEWRGHFLPHSGSLTLE